MSGAVADLRARTARLGEELEAIQVELERDDCDFYAVGARVADAADEAQALSREVKALRTG